MKIKDKAKPKLPPVEPGVYVAVCVGVVDLGEQYSEKFKKYSNDLKIIWELSGETVEVDGETMPRQLSRTFTISSSKKSNLRTFVSSWMGRQYTDDEFRELDLFDLLGRACQLNVVLSDSGEYANVDSVIPLPKGAKAPPAETPYIKWDMDEWDDGAFDNLPDYLKEKIMKSTQYQKLHLPEETVDFPPEEAAGEEVCPI